MGSQLSCKRAPPLQGPVKFTKGWPAGNESELEENGMKLVKVNETSQVLIVKSEGKIFGIGAQCTHSRAPLSQGFCQNGKIICPWHGACFNIATGDIEDFPGIDALPTYLVTQKENGDLTVFCPSKLSDQILLPMEKCRDPRKTFVIIGGGPAGLLAAQTLRQNGFDGKIQMISKEFHLPYNKTLLNKYKNITMFQNQLKDYEYFKNADIEVILSTEVVKVDFKNKEVYTDNRDAPMKYNKLLIATGSQTQTLRNVIKGGDLRNIRVINNFQDAVAFMTILSQTLKPRNGKLPNVVVIGATLIGLDIVGLMAASDSINVYLIGSRIRPLDYFIGPAASDLILEAVRLAKNILYLGAEEVKSFSGNNRGEVTHVVTSKNGSIPCDMVMLAMNPKPNTEFLKPGQLKMNVFTGAIVVDKYLKTSEEDVYAAGDVAEYPFSNCSDPSGQATTQAWNVACTHGRVAALNMLGIRVTVKNLIPFLWAKPVGICGFRIVGHLKGPADVLTFYKRDGVTNEMNMKLCSIFRRNGKLIGCVTYDCDPIASRVAFDLRGKRFWEGVTPDYIFEQFPQGLDSPICRTDMLPMLPKPN